MAYGYRRRTYRRRLTGGSYAKLFGYKAVPFTRKRPYPFGPGGGSSTGISARPRMGRRVRMRAARSYTQTQTKTKQRYGSVVKHSDNMSASFCQIGSGRCSPFVRNLLKKLISPRTVSKIISTNISSLTGYQNTTQWAINQLSDLEAMAATAAAGDKATRLFLKEAKHTLTFRNQTNCAAKCQIYDLLCIRDCPSAALGTPVALWNKGMTDYGTPDHRITVGSTPFKSPEFRRYFKVAKMTTVRLEPGQQHEHVTKCMFNRTLSSVQWENNSASYIGGLTRYVMVVFHGSLVHESATPGTVTYAPITLDMAGRYDYSFGYLESPVGTFSLTDTMAKTLVDPDQMGETNDADVNVNAA